MNISKSPWGVGALRGRGETEGRLGSLLKKEPKERYNTKKKGRNQGGGGNG